MSGSCCQRSQSWGFGINTIRLVWRFTPRHVRRDELRDNGARTSHDNTLALNRLGIVESEYHMSSFNIQP